jgi:hypothetical protein
MTEEHNLSRELADDELPPEPSETLEEARPVHRKPLASGLRASATEEKPGTQDRPREGPARDRRPDLKPPPFEASNY